jgi:hypothetical protein
MLRVTFYLSVEWPHPAAVQNTGQFSTTVLWRIS